MLQALRRNYEIYLFLNLKCLSFVLYSGLRYLLHDYDSRLVILSLISIFTCNLNSNLSLEL